MRILKGSEIPITICVSYTILSILNAVSSMISGIEKGTHINSVMMLIWCSIAVLILSIHHYFEDWSPIGMIVIQYLIAISLVFLSLYIVSFFDEISKGGYRDAFLSFTIPYIIGAVFYYISLFSSAKRQNKIIQEINEKQIGNEDKKV